MIFFFSKITNILKNKNFYKKILELQALYLYFKITKNILDYCMMRTTQDVKNELQKRGLSIAEWARQNGFTPELVHQVLNSSKLPIRGKSHAIAVKLGLKKGLIDPNFSFEKMEKTE